MELSTERELAGQLAVSAAGAAWAHNRRPTHSSQSSQGWTLDSSDKVSRFYNVLMNSWLLKNSHFFIVTPRSAHPVVLEKGRNIK